jgi:hypothetical protein
MKKKTQEVVKELNLLHPNDKKKYSWLNDSVRSLDYHIVQEDLENSEKRAKYQTIFIVQYLLPWCDENQKKFPKPQDYGSGEFKVGLSYGKVFGYKLGSRKGLFDSSKDLKKKAQEAVGKWNQLFPRESKTYPWLDDQVRDLDHKLAEKDLENPEKRSEYQRIFIVQYLLPWCDKNTEKFPDTLDYGYNESKIGLGKQKVFGLGGENPLKGIFDNQEDLLQKAREIAKEQNRNYSWMVDSL